MRAEADGNGSDGDGLTDRTTGRVRMTLASTLASVETVEEAVLESAQKAGFDEDTASHLAMVAREATANAVIHGNHYDERKQVRVLIETTVQELRIQVADEGLGLDEKSLPDPLAPENLLLCSGRGIFLIKAFMDEVHFRQLTPGLEVTLIKRRAAESDLKLQTKEMMTMSMKYKTRLVDGIMVLDLSGRITLGDGSVTLRDAVRDGLAKGSDRILLNLADVDYIDSSGLGELVSAYTTVKNRGGELKLLHLTKKVHDLLQITKLYTIFDVRDDEAHAISSFTQA